MVGQCIANALKIVGLENGGTVSDFLLEHARIFAGRWEIIGQWDSLRVAQDTESAEKN